ncbi:MAG: hypothetical protein FWH24_01055 [Oscillospiraceae bacterium]|nr:hypothetical protein [Oscillospiraceae bacterium]
MEKFFSHDKMFEALKVRSGKHTENDINKIKINAEGMISKIEIISTKSLIDLTDQGISLVGVDITIGTKGTQVKLPHSTAEPPFTAVGFTARNSAAETAVSVKDPAGILFYAAVQTSVSGIVRVEKVLKVSGEAEINFTNGLSFKIISSDGENSFYTVKVS